MMTDMREADLVPTAAHRELTLSYHDGRTRRVLVIDQEVPYPDGKLIVSRTDSAGVITHANQAFVDMSGYERDELIGESHCILRHPDMPSAAFRDLWDTVGRGAKWQGYVKNLRKDGAHYWVFATAIPMSVQAASWATRRYAARRRAPRSTTASRCMRACVPRS
ncbi:MAG: hypothetical protein RLZZ373_1141 [Pseudomonadota bacterium]